jgi:DNA-binding CsgD family transcriptional regulator
MEKDFDYERINGTVLALGEIDNQRALKEKFLSELKAYIIFDAGMIDRSKEEETRIVFFDPVAFNIAKDYVDRYYNHFQYIDTMYFFFVQDEIDEYQTSRYISDEMRESSDYYRKWLKPQNLFYSIGAKTLNNDRQLTGSVNLWRSRAKGDFSQRELAYLRILTKHFSQKLTTLLIIEEKREQSISRLKERFSAYLLTNREIEVLALLLAGFKTNEIAEKLFITPDTAKTHVKHVYHKLGVHSKIELIKEN